MLLCPLCILLRLLCLSPQSDWLTRDATTENGPQWTWLRGAISTIDRHLPVFLTSISFAPPLPAHCAAERPPFSFQESRFSRGSRVFFIYSRRGGARSSLSASGSFTAVRVVDGCRTLATVQSRVWRIPIAHGKADSVAQQGHV